MSGKFRDWRHAIEHCVLKIFEIAPAWTYRFQCFWGSLKQSWKALECCTVVSSWPSEWPDCPHSDGLLMVVAVVGIRKNRQVTNLENITHAAIQRFDVLTGILWRIMPYVAAHCHVGGITFLSPTTRGDDVECCRANVAAHLVDILIYSLKQNWPAIPICNAFSLRTFRTLVVLHSKS
jgi:hypothetical protein